MEGTKISDRRKGILAAQAAERCRKAAGCEFEVLSMAATILFGKKIHLTLEDDPEKKEG